MKTISRYTLVVAVLLLGVASIFVFALLPSQGKTLLSVASDNEMPRAERMAAKRAYFEQLYKDPQTNEVPLWSPMQKQRLINTFKEQIQVRGQQNNLVWEEAGPNNVGGRTRAIALDRRDSKVVITGGVRGGIWKSTDDGENWKHIPGLIANESIMSIAQDPLEPDHWYAVTGELVGAGANFFGGGIYRSTDNGESWELYQYALDQDESIAVHDYQRVNENILGGAPFLFCGDYCDQNPFIYNSKVAVSPTTGSVFVATNGYGVKRSSNGLQSFSHSLPEPLDIPMVDVVPLQADTAAKILLPFEEDLTNLGGNLPSYSTEISYEEGVHGLGAFMDNNAQFNWPKAEVFSGREGTVEFWFKPNWDSFTTSEHDMVLVGEFPDAIFIHHVESIIEIIHTAGDIPGQDWAIAAGSTQHWKKGEWVHLAFTWGGNEIAYYENGALVSKSLVNYTIPDNSGDIIRVGREQGGSMDGLIDEFRVSNRARSAEEVLTTYFSGGIGARPAGDPTQKATWSDVDVDQNGRLLAYLSGATSAGAGVYFSEDDGASWTNLTPADWNWQLNRGLVRFAPSNPGVGYVLFQELSSGTDREVLMKIDLEQQTLEDRSPNLPRFAFGENDVLPITIGEWLTQLDVKPDDEDFVIAGGVQLARSFDGFTSSTDEITKHHINSNSHVDHHIVVFDPAQPSAAWLGNDGGIFKTDNILRESATPYTNIQWQHKFKGYNVVTYYALGLPRDPLDFRIIGGTQDRGTPILDRANSIDPQASIGDPFGGDGGFSFLGKNHAYVYAAVGQSYRLKYNEEGLPSFDAGFLGLTGTLVNRPHSFINPFVVDLDDETAMYYPLENKLLRFTRLDEQPEFSDLQAADWEEPEGLAGPEASVITALDLSVEPKDILYYAVHKYDETPQIYRLEDAENATVPTEKHTITGASPGSWVRCVAINPENADEIAAVITSSNVPKLFHSLDGGNTFSNIDGNLANTEDLPGPHTNWLTILPFEGTTYYVLATTTGVFVTQDLDGANTFWELQAPDEIGFASAQMVRSRAADGLVAVSTYGRGIFIGGPNGVPTATDDLLVQDNEAFKLFPNPGLGEFVQLQFELTGRQKVGVKLLDLSGREVWRKPVQTFDAGPHQIELPVAALNRGMYVVQLETQQRVWARKLVLMRD
ncbi:MAG: T9SS type A sorting domain-containing protein [Saprospiraceae bacterium]|nr:T9SS type A sorting domain-containing protein [Saprospiraceae bacterium]